LGKKRGTIREERGSKVALIEPVTPLKKKTSQWYLNSCRGREGEANIMIERGGWKPKAVRGIPGVVKITSEK